MKTWIWLCTYHTVQSKYKIFEQSESNWKTKNGDNMKQQLNKAYAVKHRHVNNVKWFKYILLAMKHGMSTFFPCTFWYYMWVRLNWLPGLSVLHLFRLTYCDCECKFTELAHTHNCSTKRACISKEKNSPNIFVYSPLIPYSFDIFSWEYTRAHKELWVRMQMNTASETYTPQANSLCTVELWGFLKNVISIWITITTNIS